MNHSLAVAIGLRLKRVRQMAGLNRRQLAQLAGVGITSISYWEHTERAEAITEQSLEKIILAVKKCGVECSIQWLMTGSGTPPYVHFTDLQSADNSKFSSTTTQNLTFKYSQNKSNIKNLLNQEIDLFYSYSEKAVVATVTHHSLFPAFRINDKVGGVWQSNGILKSSEFCIIEINNRLQVRRVSRGSKPNHFNLSFLHYEESQEEPFEIADIELKKLAPIILIWRFNEIEHQSFNA